jgi:hypothetical protein
VGGIGFVVFHEHRRLTKTVRQPLTAIHDLLQIVMDLAGRIQ